MDVGNRAGADGVGANSRNGAVFASRMAGPDLLSGKIRGAEIALERVKATIEAETNAERLAKLNVDKSRIERKLAEPESMLPKPDGEKKQGNGHAKPKPFDDGPQGIFGIDGSAGSGAKILKAHPDSGGSPRAIVPPGFLGM